MKLWSEYLANCFKYLTQKLLYAEAKNTYKYHMLAHKKSITRERPNHQELEL